MRPIAEVGEVLNAPRVLSSASCPAASPHPPSPSFLSPRCQHVPPSPTPIPTPTPMADTSIFILVPSVFLTIFLCFLFVFFPLGGRKSVKS